MTARHEGAVVNMADAYSRVSGKLGVGLTSTGTGAGNAAGAIIESWNGGAPLLHITGQVASAFVETGRGYIHDCKDQFGMLRSISKEAYRVHRPEEEPSIFRRAIMVCVLLLPVSSLHCRPSSSATCWRPRLVQQWLPEA